MQAVDKGSLMGARVIDQIIDLEGITCNSDNRTELWINLPIAVIIVDIQKFNGWIEVFIPSLQANQQFLDPGVESGIVEDGNQIFNYKLVLDYFIDLFLIPFLVVNAIVFLIFFGNLLIDQSVVIHRCFVVVKTGEPDMSLTYKFVHEEGSKVDIQMSVRFQP